MNEFLITCKYMRVLLDKHAYWRRQGIPFAGSHFDPIKSKFEKRNWLPCLFYSDRNPFR